MIRHATISQDAIHYIDCERKLRKLKLSQYPDSMESLWNLAQMYRISCFWPMPDTSWGMQQGKLDAPDFDIFATYEIRTEGRQVVGEQAKFARFWKKETRGHTVHIGWATRGCFCWQVREPLDILASILYLKEELDVETEWSSGHMGTEVLTNTLEKGQRVDWIRKPDIDLSTIPFNKSARDLMFLRTLTMDDIDKYDVAYDKSSAYLSAMQRDCYQGCGTPRFVRYDKYEYSKHNPLEAGIYEIKRLDASKSRFNGVDMPLIIDTDKIEWTTTRLLNLAIEENYHIELGGGWIFDESHLVLKPYSSILWEARKHFKDDTDKYPYDQGRINAENTTKSMAVISTGRMKEDRSDWLFGVIGGARVLMIYNIIAALSKSGKTPFMVFSDELHYISEDKDPKIAVDGMMKRNGELGGYKHKYSIKITKEIVEMSQECCATPRHRVGKMQKYLLDEWRKQNGK